MMGTRVIDYSEKIADGIEPMVQSLRYAFGVDRRDNTPFSTTARPEKSTAAPAKIKPRPSGLFGYVDLD
ncbi:MAG: hypothetical protein PHI12_05355 [Dehalococcoidales bacterium]|jgi:hypothetical protein|nr:hypothetical protein [Dehalococcoidales bacterium]